MTRMDIVNAIADFMENSGVDPDSELYLRADAALLALMTDNIEDTK